MQIIWTSWLDDPQGKILGAQLLMPLGPHKVVAYVIKWPFSFEVH